MIILRERWQGATLSDRKIIEIQARSIKNAIALKELNVSNLGGDPEVKRIAKALF